MGNFIKDGTSSEDDWLGFLSPEDRVHVVNPEKGYLVTANNKVAGKYYLDDFSKYSIYTARADRIQAMIEEVIQSGEKFTVQTMRRMLTDTIDVYCLKTLPLIQESLAGQGQMLEGFDCNFSGSSYQATYYEHFYYELHGLIKKDTLSTFSVLSLHPYVQYIHSFIL